jgi:hypothetical protein
MKIFYGVRTKEFSVDAERISQFILLDEHGRHWHQYLNEEWRERRDHTTATRIEE